ncbi:MAG: Lrp/AsnC family transcriptional regulator [Pseudomonadota bacterium]
MEDSPKDARKSLDDIDRAILKILAEDGRRPVAQIAEAVGLSETPCARRIRQMESAGVIRGYAADIDPVAVDRTVSIFVFVQLNDSFDAHFDDFIMAVEKIEEVQSLHFLAGEKDFLLLVRLPHIGDLERFHREHIGAMKSVRSFQSVVGIREIFNRRGLSF